MPPGFFETTYIEVKLILSRKGFDDAYGGGPSPIMPDGRLLSLPIPERSQRSYDSISVGDGQTVQDLLEQLGLYRPEKHTGAHLDPDLEPHSCERDAGWLPSFGQCAAAESHLRNQGIGAGDIMLFFGTFRETVSDGATLRWRAGAPKRHVLFGYLELGEIVDVERQRSQVPWAATHPHLTNRRRPSNTLYVASPALSWNSRLPGGGVFRFHPSLVLTDANSTRSVWRLPRFFHPKIAGNAFSRHTRKHYIGRNDHVLLRTVSPGQEYVIDATPDIKKWARAIIRQGTNTTVS